MHCPLVLFKHFAKQTSFMYCSNHFTRFKHSRVISVPVTLQSCLGEKDVADSRRHTLWRVYTWEEMNCTDSASLLTQCHDNQVCAGWIKAAINDQRKSGCFEGGAVRALPKLEPSPSPLFPNWYITKKPLGWNTTSFWLDHFWPWIKRVKKW